MIGGSGFYSWLSGSVSTQSYAITTPYGAPSAAVTVGEVSGRRVAFLPRHGVGHALAPHAINHRANLWALRALGARQVIAPCSVGGLRADVVGPGDLVVPDQLVDRTSGRVQSFVDTGATHVPFADPYCPGVGGALAGTDPAVRRGGTMVVVDGPRFSTRAESQWYAAQGWDLVNMTGHPEAVLARELRICYAALALVTDLDAGVSTGDGVGEAEVYARFAANLDRLGDVLTRAIQALPDPTGCSCDSWADGLDLAYDIPTRLPAGSVEAVEAVQAAGAVV